MLSTDFLVRRVEVDSIDSLITHSTSDASQTTLVRRIVGLSAVRQG